MDDKKHRIFDAAHVLFLERGFKRPMWLILPILPV
jgi:hypothetical protein